MHVFYAGIENVRAYTYLPRYRIVPGRPPQSSINFPFYTCNKRIKTGLLRLNVYTYNREGLFTIDCLVNLVTFATQFPG